MSTSPVQETEILVLGAGLTGLSVAWHIGHERCQILEASSHPYGHVASRFEHGFTWDEGPHVSFTKHAYVRELFEKFVGGKFEEYPVRAVNWWNGHWIDHPAQSNLWQMPAEMREACLNSFLQTRDQAPPASAHYGDWLRASFGDVFANEFPRAYTEKYWTTAPENLTTDWVGDRVFLPKVEDVVAGSQGPLPVQTHYISTVRYPSNGGYQAYAAGLVEDARISLGDPVASIDLRTRKVTTASGATWRAQRIVSTLPLPVFISLVTDTPDEVRDAAAKLVCSELLLVQVTAPHPTRIPGNWFYVYDRDLLSTRIHCTEILSPNNAPAGHTGIQVEVYASPYRPFAASFEEIEKQVVAELVRMGFVDEENGQAVTGTRSSHHFVKWANVVCDHHRRPALQTIHEWLNTMGLQPEGDALHPMTDWNRHQAQPGTLMLAGRFGEWKYFWSDDCVMRGRAIAQALNS